MTTRSSRSYMNAAIKGNGAIPTPTAKSSGQGVAKVSLTPQQASGNLKSPGTQQQASGNLKSPGTQQNQPTSLSNQTSNTGSVQSQQNLATSPIGQMNLNNSVLNPPQPTRQHQTSQPASVSRVNRGAPVRSFVATLGPSMGDKLIDYSSSEGQKTYKRATNSLKDEYDGGSDGIAVFRLQLGQKSENEGWANGQAGDCVHIPIDGADPMNGLANAIHERTQLEEEAIRLWASREIVNQSTSPLLINRKAQNNRNMVETITNTLSKDCLMKIGLKQDRYMIDGVVIAALLYKIVMECAELETMVTSANIRQGLQESTKKLATLEGNVGAYVDFVRESLQKLHARGETTNEQDLVISLFRAFTQSTDTEFSEHFKKEELLWMSGMKVYSLESLLSDAEVMYKVKADHGTWARRSKEQEELIAMKAEFKDLNLKFSEERKKNKQLRSNSRAGGGNRPRIREGESWKLENPDNKRKMTREGKTWYWCINHNEGRGMWTIHKPADCRQARRSSGNSSGSGGNSGASGSNTSGSGSHQAMPVVQESESESEPDSDDEADY